MLYVTYTMRGKIGKIKYTEIYKTSREMRQDEANSMAGSLHLPRAF